MAGLADAPRPLPEVVKRYRDDGFWNDETLGSMLEGWARKTPDRVAIRAPDRDLTWSETYEKARRLANSLGGLGLGKGDVVGIQLPN